MGIVGLLPLLKSITYRVHIESLAGQTVAIDAYSWLHKGVYLCAYDLFHHRHNDAYVEYCMSRINLLRHYNIRPLMVFDGGPLPMKAHRETLRQKSREQNRANAVECIESGDIKGANAFVQKAVDVTPTMAYRLIQELKRAGIEYIVAPYEADAQMAYLDRIGKVAAVITEDSDLILFGCRRILYKLDKSGYADEVCISRLRQVEEIDFSGFSLKTLRQMCILSGCDYLAGINGLGLKTAWRYFKKYGRELERVLNAVRADHAHKMPLDYEAQFLKAELTFIHQIVYDPVSKSLTHLYPIDETFRSENLVIANWNFLGRMFDKVLAHDIAVGRIDPISYIEFEAKSYPSLNPDIVGEESMILTPPISQVDNALAENEELPFPLAIDSFALQAKSMAMISPSRITVKRSYTTKETTTTPTNHNQSPSSQSAERTKAFSNIQKLRSLKPIPTERPLLQKNFTYTSTDIQTGQSFAHIPSFYFNHRPRSITSKSPTCTDENFDKDNLKNSTKRPKLPTDQRSILSFFASTPSAAK